MQGIDEAVNNYELVVETPVQQLEEMHEDEHIAQPRGLGNEEAAEPSMVLDLNVLVKDIQGKFSYFMKSCHINSFSLDIKTNYSACNQNMELIKDLLAAINTKCDKILSKKNDENNYSDNSGHTVNISSSLIGFTLPVSTTDEAKKLNDVLGDKKQRRVLRDKILQTLGKNDGEVDGHFLNKVGNELFKPEILNSYTFKGIIINIR